MGHVEEFAGDKDSLIADMDTPYTFLELEKILAHAKLETEDSQCPKESSVISSLPFEVLASILAYIAVDSPKAFVRTLLVGRQFWIPHTSALFWEPLCRSVYPELENGELDPDDYGGYYNLFMQCPAIRHNGVYICMSRYFRNGEPEGISFTKPRHEVRYYRYLWLYPDGTCKSLLANYSPKIVLGIGSPTTPPMSPAYDRDAMHGKWSLARNTKELSIVVDGGPRNCEFHFRLFTRSSGGKVHNKLKWKQYWCKDNTNGSISEFNTKSEGSYYFHKTTNKQQD